MQPIDTNLDWDAVFAVTLTILKFFFGIPTLPEASDVRFPQPPQATTVVLRVEDRALYKQTLLVLEKRLKKLSYDFSVTEKGDGSVVVEARTTLDSSEFLPQLVQPGRLEVWRQDALMLAPEHFAGGEAREWGLLIKLTPEGSRILADMTSRFQGEAVSMRMDGQEIAAPVIQEPIKNGELLLSSANSKEFLPLLLFLECGALPSKVSISRF